MIIPSVTARIAWLIHWRSKRAEDRLVAVPDLEARRINPQHLLEPDRNLKLELRVADTPRGPQCPAAQGSMLSRISTSHSPDITRAMASRPHSW